MKEVPVKNDGDELSADEYSLCTSQECQNQVRNTAQTLSEANIEQLTQSTIRLAANAVGYEDTGGVPDNYLLSLRTTFSNAAPTSLFVGFNIFFEVDNANTGAVTINVESLGAKSLLNNDVSQLSADQLVPDTINYAFYDGTNFVLVPLNATDASFKAALANETPPNQGDKLVGHTGETVFSAIDARPTSTTLAADTGAALIGTSSGDTVQDELDGFKGMSILAACRTLNDSGSSRSNEVNISSVNNISTGNYVINFTTALPNTDYIVMVSVGSTDMTVSYINAGTTSIGIETKNVSITDFNVPWSFIAFELNV